MKIFGYEIRREQKAAQFEDVLMRLIAAREGTAGTITPETCEQSPTVKAIVTAVSNRLAVTPVHVYRRKTVNGREAKEQLPNHPVATLLRYPNAYQTRTSFWADAASSLVRWGNFYAYKGRGQTGPIRFLEPMKPSAVTVEQNPGSGSIVYRYGSGTMQREYTPKQVLHVRGTARDFVVGDSPVKDVANSIALEVAAERYGLSFFDNGALPLLIFKYMQGTAAFKTKEQEQQFVADFQEAFGGKNRHRALLLPKGLEAANPISVENDKAQMIESRRYQRTVIAGAFGVPPQYVGDLERATFNNAEQQTIQFTADVIYPVVQKFEAALERDLLTDEDWAQGVIIRFNLDSILRADFKSRQEGLQIQRQNGVLSANEWREIEGKNPISDEDGGENYIYPSNMLVAGEEPEPEPPPAPANDAEDEPSITMSVPVNVYTNVGGATVDVKGSETTVNTEAPAAPDVNIDVKHPDINIAPASVNVTQPEINVMAPPPEIRFHADVAAPTVHVAAPEVKVDNHVESPTVNVEAPNVILEAKMPKPSVEIQPITIKSPDVTVNNVLPDYEEVESEAVRDDKGRLHKTVTRKRRK